MSRFPCFRRAAQPHPPGRRRTAAAALAWALGAVLVLVLSPAPAAAQGNATLDLVRLYQSDLRALAMGNAFGPVARGETALLYNPAGLVQREFDIKLEYALSVAGVSGDFFSDTVDMFEGDPSSAEVQAYLEKYLGTTQRYYLRTFPNAVANLALFNIGLGGGLLDVSSYGISFLDNGGTPDSADANDTLQLDEQHLDMKVGSFAFELMSGQLLLGATLKSFTFENKTASDTFGNVVTNADIDLDTAGDSYDASGFDVGFIWRFETLSFLRAQWSAAFHNVGGIALEATGSPTLEIPGTVNVGLTLQPELPWSPVHLILTAEVEDASGEIVVRDASGVDHDRSLEQRTRVGAELGLWETSTGNHLISVRAGSHRGQATAGFELNVFSGLRLLYTRYKDDFGHEDNPQVEAFDAVQVSLGFAF